MAKKGHKKNNKNLLIVAVVVIVLIAVGSQLFSITQPTTAQYTAVLMAAGFTNVTPTNTIATVFTGPAHMFSAFDANSPGLKNVLIIAFPAGSSYQKWNATTPTTYSYYLTNTTTATGTLYFFTATSIGGGKASGSLPVNYISWKELLYTPFIPTTSVTTTTPTSTSVTVSTTSPTTSVVSTSSTTSTTTGTSTSTVTTTIPPMGYCPTNGVQCQNPLGVIANPLIAFLNNLFGWKLLYVT